MSVPSWIKVAFRHAYRSLREFSFLAFFSFMPVWLGMLLHFILKQNVVTYLNGYLLNGEALLLSATTVGPLFFTLVNAESEALPTNRQFPFKWIYYLSIVGVCAIAAALIGVKAAPNVDNYISSEAMWTLSMAVSLFSIFIWFAIIGTNSAHQSGAPEVMRQDQNDYVNNFRSAR